MGMGKKILWWLLYYAVTWFCLLIVWGVISGIGIFPNAFMGLLVLLVFVVSGWYATRKVKQKALKEDMKQRTVNTVPQQQFVQPPTPVKQNIKPPQPRSTIQSIADVTPSASAPSVPKVLPNLNNASADDLAKLSGVNRILAMKIISVKEKDGPYSSIEDLFARVQLTPQVQEEVRCHFTIASSGEGRFIDF